MKQVCFIGDSSVAALKTGYDILNEKNFEPTFFAAWRNKLGTPRLSGRSLVFDDPRKYQVCEIYVRRQGTD